MPLTGHGSKLLQRNSAKFKWLARHRKSKILGNNGDTCLLWMERFILRTRNISVKVHFKAIKDVTNVKKNSQMYSTTQR